MAADIIYPVAVDPTISNADWKPMNGVPGVNGIVYHLVYANDMLYVGGEFNVAATIRAVRFAAWNGAAWGTLDSAITGVNIYSLEKIANGKDGNPVIAANSGISRWNGKKWDTLHTGINGVYAVACDTRGTVYIAGDFIGRGEAFNNRISQWDGTRWSAVGSGVDSAISALVCDKNGNVYAAGRFDSAGGVAARHIAKWNGSAWSALGSGLSGYGCALSLDSSGNLYAAGYFHSAGGAAASRIARWNGSAWTPLSSGIRGSWQNVGSLTLCCDKSGSLLVGGHFDTAGNIPVNNIARWDGNKWNALGPGIDIYPGPYQGVYCMAFDGSGNLYAGGDFGKAGGITAFNIARWDGAAWNSLCPQIPEWGITGVVNKDLSFFAIDDFKNLYAGGNYSGLAKWDGTGWQKAPSGRLVGTMTHLKYLPADTAGINGVEFNGAFASAYIGARKIGVAAHNNRGNLFCAADDTGRSQTTAYFKWNGSAWDSIGSARNAVTAMVCDASGNFYSDEKNTASNRVLTSNLKKWDGNRLSDFASFSGQRTAVVRSIVCDPQGNVYVAGDFSAVNECKAYGIARWNGISWENLGTPYEYDMQNFFAIACDENGRLYAGSTGKLYRFDQTYWSELGAVERGNLLAVAIIDSTVFIGGNFEWVAGRYTPYIAGFNIRRSAHAIVKIPDRDFPSVPRYRQVNATIVFAGVTPLDRIGLYSLAGRCVRTVLGASKISVGGLSPQPLLLRIVRQGRIIASGMVMVQ